MFRTPQFRTPQVVLFSSDVERLAEFYKQLGFVESFRVPTHGIPIHIDVKLDGYVIGIASIDSTRDDHRLAPVTSGQRAAVVLWTDDTDGAYTALTQRGCRGLHPPHVWLDRLRIAWIADPDEHPVQIVQHLTPVSPSSESAMAQLPSRRSPRRWEVKRMSSNVTVQPSPVGD